MMEIITRWWRPSQPEYDPAQFTEDIVYPVHLHDANFAKVLMVCTMRFDSVLDAAKLHSSLTRLLEIGDWKKVGGRLRRNVGGPTETCNAESLRRRADKRLRLTGSWRFTFPGNIPKNGQQLHSHART